MVDLRKDRQGEFLIGFYEIDFKKQSLKEEDEEDEEEVVTRQKK